MGVRVGRIVKEFVFKSLLEQGQRIDIHGNKKNLAARLLEVDEKKLTLQPIEGDPAGMAAGEPVRVFFFFQNNYHTFETTVLEPRAVPAGATGTAGSAGAPAGAAAPAGTPPRLYLKHPEGVYKNPQRKYERIRPSEAAEVYFTLKGKKVELSFPRFGGSFPVEDPRVSDQFDPRSIDGLIREFRKKIAGHVQVDHILMMRNRVPSSYEEKLLAATGKIFWIPSVDEGFPLRDPFPEERIITKKDLARYEESIGTPPPIIPSKIANILYEKQKKGIYSEVYCPVLYDVYMIGYIRLANMEQKREKIGKETLEYLAQFAQVLSYALKINGYFDDKGPREQRYEAQIIDISASGLLFAHPAERLAEELQIHTDLELFLKLGDRRMQIGSQVRRKFQDKERSYFGVQFLRIDPQDFRFLFELLYGKPLRPEDENSWEGGTPPPTLNLFE